MNKENPSPNPETRRKAEGKPGKNRSANELKDATAAKDRAKTIVALLIAGAGVFAYYRFADLPVYLRALFPTVGVILALAIVFFFCAFGRNLLVYIRESTQEMRKVVWPDKPTALRMTLTVIAFVAVLALFMALADGLVSWILFDLLFKRG